MLTYGGAPGLAGRLAEEAAAVTALLGAMASCEHRPPTRSIRSLSCVVAGQGTPTDL